MLVLKITLLLVKNLFFGVKKGMSYWGFIFTWDLGVIFLGIPSFKILRFRKKLFFQIQILRFHIKMYKLFPCRPVCRGRERVFLFKKCKKNCMCGWVKNRIDTCEKLIFWCQKVYEWILALGGPKTYYLHLTFVHQRIFSCLLFSY